MFRLLLLLVIIAAVGAYFTKPDRAAHEAQARTTLEAAQRAAADNIDLGSLINLGLGGLTQEGRFEDLYLVTKYTATVQNRPFMECWGAFTQVRCTLAATAQPDAPASE